MPLNIPNLDDRNYSDLVAEAIAMIPRYAPSWTNYNPSDPGITLIELLAYFTEMLIYRLDRVGTENKINFLKLLIGSKASEPNYESLKKLSVHEVDALIKDAVLGLKLPHRAITQEDYEYLAKEAVVRNFKDITTIRAHCIFGKNLGSEGDSRDIDRPGHISVVLVAGIGDSTRKDQELIEELDPTRYAIVAQEVQNKLESKCLITTRLHVIKPCYIWITLSAGIHSRSVLPPENLLKVSSEKLAQYFSPFKGGGRDFEGWPLGRNVYLSEIVEVLERIPEVDFIDNAMVLRLATTSENLSHTHSKIGIQIGVCSCVGVDTILGMSGTSNKDRLITDGTGKLSGIKLKPYELVKVVLQDENKGNIVHALSEVKDNYV